MAKKAPKPRPMKSRKNGLKWKKLVEDNQKVLNAIQAIQAFQQASITPSKG
jgi:hypothetical protein